MRGAALADAADVLDHNRQLGLDLLRIYLGVALFVRGAMFISRPEVLLDMIQRSGGWFWPAAAAHYIAGVHIVGGLMLAAGLYTRLAALAQIPVLLGAVLFTHWSEGLLGSGALELSVLVLVMLVIFAIFGAGRLSIDRKLRARTVREEPRRGWDAPSDYEGYARH